MKDILPGKISKSTGHFVPDECSKYSFINETFTLQNQTCLPNSFDHKKLRCNRWVFDEHERTIINDVSLTFDKNKIRNFNNMAIFSGQMNYHVKRTNGN